MRKLRNGEDQCPVELRTGLRSKLYAAGQAMEGGDATTAGKILDAFLREVVAQSGRGMAAEAAFAVESVTRDLAAALKIPLTSRKDFDPLP